MLPEQIGEVMVSETTTSGGRFFSLAIDVYPEGYEQPIPAYALLDVQGAKELIRMAEEWLASQGFVV